MHAIVNVCITVLTLPALLGVDAATDVCALRNHPGASFHPLYLAFELHLWHVAFFSLSWADVVHHGLFVVFLGVPGGLFEFGLCGNVQLFFMCGLPGAVHYAVLAAQSIGRWTNVDEPWAAFVLKWTLRMPGALVAQYLLYRSWVTGGAQAPPWAIVPQLTLGPVNAVYYAWESARRLRRASM